MSECMKCTVCGLERELALSYKCSVCGGIVEVAASLSSTLINPEKSGIWQYENLLPPASEQITLGEGNTPLIEGRAIGRELGLERLFFKLESLNPTCSFKDRGIAVSVSMAKKFRAKGIIVSSTGNASASAAAYGAKAGMPVVVCVPASTESNKIKQAIGYGALVVLVDGNFSDAYNLVAMAASRLEYANVSTTFINPYNLEGNKTVAYELYKQHQGSLDAVIIPTGAGPLLAGMHKGFKDLLALGLIKKIPRLIAAQAQVCAPIVRACEASVKEVTEWKTPFSTLAQGAGDPLIGYSDDGTRTLESVIETRGCAVGVSEDEILTSMRTLAEKEGIFAEPTASLGVGALKKLLEQKFIAPSDNVAVIITGHGLKHFAAGEFAPPTVKNFQELSDLLLN